MEQHPDPILIVEDSEVSRTMLVLLFEKAGYEVVSHADGDEALAELTARRFSMLILDQQLPGKTGIELLEADRKHNRNTPAIFVTGNLQLDDAVKISHLGIAGIFTKPADPVALLRKASEITQKIDPSSTPLIELENESESAGEIEKEAPAVAVDSSSVAYATTHFPAASSTFIALTHRLWKIRNFRNTLLVTGSAGTLYEEIVRDMHEASDWAQGPIRIYPNKALAEDTLLDLLAHSLVDETPATVVIHSIHKLDSEGQQLLKKVVGFDGVFMPFAQRVRFVLTSDSDLNPELESGSFDETLHFRIGSVTATIPDMAAMREDILPIARHFLETSPKTGDYRYSLQLTNEAANWLKSQDWAESFDELKYLLEITIHFANRREVNPEILINVCQLIDTGSAPTRPELAIEAANAVVVPTPSPSVKSAVETTKALPVNNETTSPPNGENDADSSDEIAPDVPVAAPPRQGVASYLPSDLSSAEIEAAISSSTTTRKQVGTTTKRRVERKKPGSYDFNDRLAKMLSDQTDQD